MQSRTPSRWPPGPEPPFSQSGNKVDKKSAGMATDAGIKSRDSKKDAPFCEEGESILRDDLAPNLQGLTFDMKSYCVGVLSPKFIHQLFTVNGDRISVGNYEGWVFSLRQKECDTADTPNLMCRSQCPRGVRGGEELFMY